VPEAVVMEMVGHDSEQMSAHYTHVGREALEKAASSLRDFGVRVDDLHRRRRAAGYFGEQVDGSGELDHSLLILISRR